MIRVIISTISSYPYPEEDEEHVKKSISSLNYAVIYPLIIPIKFSRVEKTIASIKRKGLGRHHQNFEEGKRRYDVKFI